MTKQIEKGLLDKELPYLRLAGGPGVLVFFPAISDPFQDVRSGAGVFKIFFRKMLKTHTLWLVGRRRNLPEGTTLQDMARDYQGAITAICEREGVGAREVVISGLSMGGMLALRYAVDFPDQFGKLVVISAAHRLGPEALALEARLRTLADRGRWITIVQILLSLTFTGVWKGAVKTGAWLAGPFILLGRTTTNDAHRSLEAIENFDLSKNIKTIKAPALLIAGDQDRFFPADICREAEKLMPGAELVFIEGEGHGGAIQNTRAFQKEILRFLNR